MNTARPPKSGAILICVLACLLISLSLIATSLQMSLRARRECKASNAMRQTSLLVDAGVYRALHRLRASSAYRGELWKPSISVTGNENVSIEINPPPSNDRGELDELEITVVARIDSTEAFMSPIQQSRTFTIPLSELSNAESISCP